jgi:uncharacterized protein
VIGLVLLALVAPLAYASAAVVVYDRVSRIGPSCGEDRRNSPGAFRLERVDTAPYQTSDAVDLRFASRDPGIEVAGWLIRAPAASVTTAERSAVVVVHGLGGCRRSGGVLLAAGMLVRNGIDALVIDLRDHGDSSVEDGRFAGGTDEHRDVLGAFDRLVAEGYEPARIGLMGFSLGAATVLIAGGQEPRVAAVWEDSSYADLDRAIRDELRRTGYPTFLAPAAGFAGRLVSGDDLASLSPLDAVRRSGRRPLAITHGTGDRRISVEYAHELERAARDAGGLVETWIVDGAAHTEAIVLHTAEYERRMAAFFVRELES